MSARRCCRRRARAWRSAASAEPTGSREPIVPGASDAVRPARRLSRRRATARCSSATPAITGLLIWRKPPDEDDATGRSSDRPAGFFARRPQRQGRGRRGDAQRADRRCRCDGVLAVADAWNHRVLIWHGYPDASNRPADVVLGQADFSSRPRQSRQPTRRAPNAATGAMASPSPTAGSIVADTGNRRVLVWNEIPQVERRAGRSRCWGSAISPPATRMPARRPARWACAGRTPWRSPPECSSSPTPATTA